MRIFVYKIDNFYQKIAKIVYFCLEKSQGKAKRHKDLVTKTTYSLSFFRRFSATVNEIPARLDIS